MRISILLFFCTLLSFKPQDCGHFIPEMIENGMAAEVASGIQKTYRSWGDFDRIDPASIKSRAELKDQTSYPGWGYARIEKGNVNNEPVFIKSTRRKADLPKSGVTEGLSFRAETQNIAEARMAQLLEWMDMAPRFHGVFKNKLGQNSLVYGWVEGTELKPRTDEIQHDLKKFSDKRLIELTTALEKWKEIAKHANFIVPEDFSIRVDPSGKPFIIDTEFFKIDTDNRGQNLFYEDIVAINNDVVSELIRRTE